MNMFKRILAASLLAFASSTAFGINIDGVVIEEGKNLQVGSEFYYTVGEGVGTEGQGVGEILEIRNEAGDVTWSDGDNGVDLWFVFDDLTVNAIDTTITGEVVTTTGGTLQFYTLAAGTFDQTGVFANDSASITGGDLWLDTVLTEIDLGGGDTASTINLDVSGDGDSYTGTGYLDIIGGSAASVLDTNTIDNDFDSQLSDIRWNYSVDNEQQFGEYNLTGSSDFRTNGVPTPMPIALLSIGLIGMVGARKLFS